MISGYLLPSLNQSNNFQNIPNNYFLGAVYSDQSCLWNILLLTILPPEEVVDIVLNQKQEK